MCFATINQIQGARDSRIEFNKALGFFAKGDSFLVFSCRRICVLSDLCGDIKGRDGLKFEHMLLSTCINI